MSKRSGITKVMCQQQGNIPIPSSYSVYKTLVSTEVEGLSSIDKGGMFTRMRREVQVLVFDAKRKYMTKMVSSTRGGGSLQIPQVKKIGLDMFGVCV